ncbi:P27 family phage terminase small subunit [Planktomarina temperata]|uniref:Phage terminase n=1 Tax=Planktomarina temperata RCA23 TaxID=666509 RepID=A0AAN0RKG1_9RHOB|nr:putative phage terminase [Planktomarina temperata RCA23]
MSQKKRSDKNSVTAALGGFKGAIESVPLPQGVELRSDDELIIWGQFTRARAREDWRDMDLILLAKVVRMEADIRQHQASVEEQGVIIENQRGTPIPNPLLAIIDTVERRQLAVIRSMSLNQQASSIEPLLLLSGANY